MALLIQICGAKEQFRSINLFWDESKLTSYIDNMLVPIATALKDHKALLAWEIINEAEGQGSPDSRSVIRSASFNVTVRGGGPSPKQFWPGLDNPDKGLVYNNKADDEQCFDTTVLQGLQGTTDRE